MNRLDHQQRQSQKEKAKGSMMEWNSKLNL